MNWDFETSEKLLCELYVTLHCEGYYEPAKISGPPENCYPAEGEDIREVIRMDVDDREGAMELIEHEGKRGYFLPAELVDEIVEDWKLEDLE